MHFHSASCLFYGLADTALTFVLTFDLEDRIKHFSQVDVDAK